MLVFNNSNNTVYKILHLCIFFKRQEIAIIMLFAIVLIFIIYFIIALQNTLIFLWNFSLNNQVS